MKGKRISGSEEETYELAEEFLRDIDTNPPSGATVIALSGELGSGKTVFVRGIARALGIEDTVQSPTFVLERMYEIENHPQFKKLIHIDTYRMDHSNELGSLGWNEIIADAKNLICVEWAERVEDLLPPETRKVHCIFIDENKRDIQW